MIRKSIAVGIATGLVAAAGSAQGQQSAVPDSLSEIYGNWTVECTATPDADRAQACAIAQHLTEGSSGQTVLLMEFNAVSATDGLSGLMIVPFGLAVTQPVDLMLDGDDFAALPMSTCEPRGCLVALDFDAEQLTAMQSADSIVVSMTTAADDASTFTVELALNGFADAYQRLMGLLE